MRMETRTFEVRFRMFDVGERIRRQEGTLRAHAFPGGVHRVVRCEAPLFPGDPALVWIEGYDVPRDTTYLTTAEEESDA